jgi:serine/threonine protein kinase
MPIKLQGSLRETILRHAMDHHDLDANQQNNISGIDGSGLLPYGRESGDNWSFYENLFINGKTLGHGSSGITYPAIYKTKDDKQTIECVIKLPMDLMKSGKISIQNNQLMIVNPSMHKKSAEYENAIENLEMEWVNSFRLHFGPKMTNLNIQKNRSNVNRKDFKDAVMEARLIAKHPGFENIHRLFGMDIEIPFLISESFRGTLNELSRILHSQNNYSILFSSMLPQTVNGIHFMHNEAHLAHMDIKPENILYRFESANPLSIHCVLCDFGDCKDAMTPIKKTNIGTPGYIAPEINSCLRDPTASYIPVYTDAFAWSVAMLYTLNIHSLNPEPIEIAGPLSLIESRITRTDHWEHYCQSMLLQIANLDTTPQKRYQLFQDVQDHCLHLFVDREIR